MSITGDDPTAAEAPTQSTPTVDLGQAADRCATCGADLAPDQRYCVDCGTRRGRPRFDLKTADGSSIAGPVIAPDAYAASTSTRGVRSISSSAALLGTVACLLLAVLVGYLIGHGGNHQTNSAPHVTINETGGGAGGGTASSSTAATGSTGSGSTASGGTGSSSSATKTKTAGKSSSSSAPKATGAPVAVKPVTSKSGLKAAKKQAATTGANNSSLGISTKHSAPATQKIGAPCKNGEAGCVNGKYTGAAF